MVVWLHASIAKIVSRVDFPSLLFAFDCIIYWLCYLLVICNKCGQPNYNLRLYDFLQYNFSFLFKVPGSLHQLGNRARAYLVNMIGSTVNF